MEPKALRPFPKFIVFTAILMIGVFGWGYGYGQGTAAAPTITTLTICSGTNAISGTCESSAVFIRIYANGSTLIGTATATDTWNIIVSPNFISGDIITATADNGDGEVGSTNSVTISLSPTPLITNNSGTTIITCTTPTISVTASGGTGYAWSGGSTPATDTNSFTAAGTFVVTVTAANGCTATSAITVTQDITPPTPVITNNTVGATTIITCTTPTITVTASGGTGYAWSGGATPATAANSFTAAGTFVVTVTAANGCTATSAITVTQDITPPTP
ncbi:MAG: hypothetical protein WCO63_12805, partial [Bacteroidota bacterium]